MAESLAERLQEVERVLKSSNLDDAIADVRLDCLIGIDANGIITEWNEASERTFMFTREEAIGQKMSELIIPPFVREIYESGKGQQMERRIEMTGQRADGSQFPCEIAIKKITDAKGEPTGYIAYLRDVTEKKRYEAWTRRVWKRESAKTAIAEELDAKKK